MGLARLTRPDPNPRDRACLTCHRQVRPARRSAGRKATMLTTLDGLAATLDPGLLTRSMDQPGSFTRLVLIKAARWGMP